MISLAEDPSAVKFAQLLDEYVEADGMTEIYKFHYDKNKKEYEEYSKKIKRAN